MTPIPDRPVGVPDAAVLWRFNSAPRIDAQVTLNSVIAGLQAEIDRENYMGAAEFQANAVNWFANAMRNRNWGLDPLTNNPKPTGSRFGASKQKLNVLSVDSDPGTALAWVWVSDDGPIGVCPDLPAAAPKTTGDPWASLH
jgi:hypothetical protein